MPVGPDSKLDGYGWLCPTPAHRARMLDMGPRIVRARVIAILAVGIGLLPTIDEVGGWGLALFALAVVNLVTLDSRIKRSKRPERVVAGSLITLAALICGGAALTGGGASPVLALVLVPVATTAMRFRAAAVWLAAAIGALMVVAAVLVGGKQAAIDHPLNLTIVLVLLVALTAVVTALSDAEVQFRDESALDSLTGLLNRSGLEARFAEIAEQARRLDRPVCVIICDLDGFKLVNDDHGHERGDAVLCGAGNELRSSLRSFELLYRLGGEEFLVLLPGVDMERGLEIAENLREALEFALPGGVAITASFGVSAARGAIEFEDLYRGADAALYRAKDAGRNLVLGAEVDRAVALAGRTL
ncbi:MAG: two-component system, cell cycle response regulator [Thermoleophilaceae bacterium]|nr:two-component system, cell cycle response regulator [Thermoleophilaceae bacterium]